jgi:hypothetical protein
MEALPLELIGWLYVAGCGTALLAGTWLTVGVLMNGGERGRKELASRLLEDLLLYSIWLLGLAGGIGVLVGKGWSRPALELFCWTLMVLVVLSGVRRYRAVPAPAFIVPVIAFCIATILTLRSDGVVKQLSSAWRILAG